MNRIIIPTGYMGSGSSAITDLISEYDGYDADNGSFEYVFLHCPNGLFDLEDKLLKGNNALRSDEALHSFRQEMKELYDRRFWWPGNYKTRIGEKFIDITDDFVKSLIEFEPNYYWYYQEKLDFKAFLQMAVRKCFLVVSGGRIVLKKPLTHPQMWLAMPSSEEFYAKAKAFLKRIWTELGIERKNLILDQLLLPFNLDRMQNYFDENAECFVVERDPRDVFISNKYVWTKQDCPIPYPTDVHDFCKMYKKMMLMERHNENKHVHVFQFEDLIYNYEISVERVQKILGISANEHTKPRTMFNPDKSIHNTQLFRSRDYKEEIQIIETELGEFLYDFPYEINVELEKVF